jgi:hypothetical protein
MMPDLLVAAMIFVFLLALAVAAPIWGYDSRDGVESDDFARRASWLYDRHKTTVSATRVGRHSGGTSQPAGASLLVGHRHHHDDAELCHAALMCIA